MDKIDCVRKIIVLLNDENTYIKMTSNPLKNFQTSFNKCIKEILHDHPEEFNLFKSFLPK